MRMTIDRDALLRCVQAAAKVAAKADTRLLASVLVEAGDGRASLSATDLDQFATASDLALVEDPGSALVGASGLLKAVRAMPRGAVTVEAAGASASVSGGKACFDLPALDSADWQGFPSGEYCVALAVDADALRDAVRAVAPFCARDDGRAVLTGLHLRASGGELAVEATDSYRAARRSVPCGDGELEAIVPRDFALAMCDAISGEAALAAGGNRFTAACDGAETGTRVIEGRYPDLGMFDPKAPAYSLAFPSREMSAALARASQLGNGSYALHLSVSHGVAELTGSLDGQGAFRDEVPCDGELEFDANLEYLRSCVDALDGGDARASGDGPLKPMVIEGGASWSLVMPVRR